MKIFTFIYVWFVATATNLVLLPACVEGQVVTFMTSSEQHGDVVLEGQQLDFLCSTEGFDSSMYQVEIRFQNDLLMRYQNGTFTHYSSQPIGYYKAQLTRTDQNSPTGITFTINQVKKTDAGQYQCDMVHTVTRYNSQVIDISVVPEPDCLAAADSSGEAVWEPKTHTYNVLSGASVDLVCVADSESNGRLILLEWSRSDGKAVMQTNNQGFATVSIYNTTFTNDDSVTFTCTSKIALVEDITHTCKVILVITLAFNNESSTIPHPTSLTTTNTNQTQTTVYNNTERENELGLLAATGAAGGLLCLTLIIVACICIFRSAKRKRKDTSEEYNDRLVRSGGSLEIASLPTSKENYSTQDLSSSAEPTYGNSEHTRFVYPSIHHKKEKPDSYQIDDTGNNLNNFLVEGDVANIQTNESNVENDNEDHSQKFEARSINVPSSKTTTRALPAYAAIDKRKQSISSVVSDADESLPSYATVDKNRNRQSKTISMSALPETAAKGEEGGLHYADVDLTNVSSAGDTMQRRVSSVVSDDAESLPSYATVDKSRDGQSRSVGLAAYASPGNPINEDRGGLHYADVDLTHSSSTRKPGARSPESLYASVP